MEKTNYNLHLHYTLYVNQKVYSKIPVSSIYACVKKGYEFYKNQIN